MPAVYAQNGPLGSGEPWPGEHLWLTSSVLNAGAAELGLKLLTTFVEWARVPIEPRKEGWPTELTARADLGVRRAPRRIVPKLSRALRSSVVEAKKSIEPLAALDRTASS